MSKIMVGVTGKNRTPRYQVTIPKDIAEEFVENNGKEVNIKKVGKNKIVIEKVSK